jgi:hypothetical protein
VGAASKQVGVGWSEEGPREKKAGEKRSEVTFLLGGLTHGCDKDVPLLILRASQLAQLLHQLLARVAHASLCQRSRYRLLYCT